MPARRRVNTLFEIDRLAAFYSHFTLHPKLFLFAFLFLIIITVAIRIAKTTTIAKVNQREYGVAVAAAAPDGIFVISEICPHASYQIESLPLSTSSAVIVVNR